MTHTVIMPDLGQTAAEGKIVRWLKKPGDRVSRGEALLEVETDKVTMEVECYKAGYLRAILASEGEMASAMSPIAVLTDRPDEAYDSAATGDAGRAGSRPHDIPSPPSAGSYRTAPGASLPVGLADGSRVPATPAAKSRARESNLDIRRVVPSRPDGLITRRDVDSAQARQAPSRPAPMAAITTKSFQSIPHFHVTIDADVSAVLAWQSRWNTDHPDLRLSLNDVFVRVAALALRDVPALNVRYSNSAVMQRNGADLLLVVATAGGGLSLVPISDPSLLSWEDYAGRVQRTLKGVVQSRVSPPRPEGQPALAVSNLGMFGVKQFTAIIPPGSTAILAIGAVRQEAVVRNRQVEVGEACSLTLASDHRVVDGITAAKFLERIQVHLRAL